MLRTFYSETNQFDSTSSAHLFWKEILKPLKAANNDEFSKPFPLKSKNLWKHSAGNIFRVHCRVVIRPPLGQLPWKQAHSSPPGHLAQCKIERQTGDREEITQPKLEAQAEQNEMQKGKTKASKGSLKATNHAQKVSHNKKKMVNCTQKVTEKVPRKDRRRPVQSTSLKTQTTLPALQQQVGALKQTAAPAPTIQSKKTHQGAVTSGSPACFLPWASLWQKPRTLSQPMCQTMPLPQCSRTKT